nr:PREDICTED: CD276 antigen-like [Lepisosteus oculatus]
MHLHWQIGVFLVYKTLCMCAGKDCIAIMGESTVLPCVYRKGSELDLGSIAIEWRSDSVIVHSFVYGKDALDKQGETYINRTQLFLTALKMGNFSLRLSDISMDDARIYKCIFHQNGLESSVHLDQVCLTPAAHYTEPVVQRDGVTEGGEAQFNCSSGQGFPKPTVHWLINGECPPVDTVRSTVTQEPDTKLFSVRSLLTVNVTQEIIVSCTIENHRLKENKTSAVIYYSIQKDTNAGTNTAQVVGGVVGGFLLAVLIGVAMWKRRELFKQCGIAQ